MSISREKCKTLVIMPLNGSHLLCNSVIWFSGREYGYSNEQVVSYQNG